MSEKEIADGVEAEYIANHPVFKSAVQRVKDGIISAMARSPIGDAETHHKLVISLQVLDQISHQIQDVINTGQMAKLQLKDVSLLRKAAGF